MPVCISFEQERIDFDCVHHFLSTQTRWAAGIPAQVLKRALSHSLCVGAYDGERQTGFARVVTDYATFAYLCDVFVLDEYRGRGIARQLTQALLEHADLARVRRILLVTSSAHGLYAKLGFGPAPAEDIMQIHRPDVYANPSLI